MSSHIAPALPYTRARSIEWPTVALAILIYGGWLALTLFWRAIPLWLLMPLGGVAGRLAGLAAARGDARPPDAPSSASTTRSAGRRFRCGCPIRSISSAIWPSSRRAADRPARRSGVVLRDGERLGRAAGVAARPAANSTRRCSGGMLVGPAFMIGFFLADECQAGGRGRAAGGAASGRGTTPSASLRCSSGWRSVCGMPLWLYFVGFVYAGGALTRIRSFAEHRFAERHEERTAIVEHGGLLGVLYPQQPPACAASSAAGHRVVRSAGALPRRIARR